MEVGNGSLQWKFAMKVYNGSLQWKLQDADNAQTLRDTNLVTSRPTPAQAHNHARAQREKGRLVNKERLFGPTSFDK